MKSIIIKIGNNIPAAVWGLIVRDIRGIDKIAIGPANPPFDIPNKITPIDAVKKKNKSTTKNYLRNFSASIISLI